jgi:hypothetical protein
MLIDSSTYMTCQIQDWEYLSQKQWATPRTLIFVRQYKTLLNKQFQSDHELQLGLENFI